MPEPIVIPIKIIRDIQFLEDSLVNLAFDLEDIKSRIKDIVYERQILLNNKLMKGESDTIPELKLAMEYLSSKIKKTTDELRKLKRKEYYLTKEQTAQQKRLNKLKAYNSQINPIKPELPKNQIVISVSADYEVSGKIEVEYLVNNAGWIPEYDIRAEGINKPINLVYKANVYQNSGEDWKNVKLKLSTIAPSENKTKPALYSQYLNYFYPATLESVSLSRNNRNLKPSITLNSNKEDLELDMVYQTSAQAYNYTQVTQTMTNIEYDINLKYTIPSDGKYHKVAIRNQEMQVEYYHCLVPKLDRQAYLIAKITDWGKYDVLSANANIYFEGTYVGETQINTISMQDTLELSLGKDRSITVERVKNKDEIRNVLIGNNQVKTVKYDIKIKNNKSFACNLIIQDQKQIIQKKQEC